MPPRYPRADRAWGTAEPSGHPISRLPARRRQDVEVGDQPHRLAVSVEAPGGIVDAVAPARAHDDDVLGALRCGVVVDPFAIAELGGEDAVVVVVVGSRVAQRTLGGQ